MANILDYLKWRGDLKLKHSKFNEIDNVILSSLAYYPFDNILKDNDMLSIRKINKIFKKQEETKNDPGVEFLDFMGKSKRFGKMKVTDYVNKHDIKNEKQFSAMTILMPDNSMYVAFRGTDSSIVGWKENLNLFVKSNIPSQIEAVKYLEKIARKFPDRKIRVGGHSKGGNLAIYASVFADEDIKDRIINIYNNDGPGFNNKIVESRKYKQMVDKINTYIPQSSIIGRLLNNKGKYTVINSSEKGFMQHDTNTWQVSNTGFEILEDTSKGSKILDKSIRDWLETISVKQREEVINVVFDILYSTEVENFDEMGELWFEKTKKIINTYKDLDKETRKKVIETIKEFWVISKKNWLEEHEKINNVVKGVTNIPNKIQDVMNGNLDR